ncbi:MAG: ComEC/Rec2 family competence protein [Kiritimatiellae bacterium]|nr:ComEC/Rec2 family competence protein [Kiritimatiellia bacterium]MDD5520324.1 ComEC/Rec2 family competence protein [Kiritimatiellia bacterium]
MDISRGRFVRRPVIGLVISFILGTYSGLTFDFPCMYLLGMAFLFDLCAGICVGLRAYINNSAVLRWFTTMLIGGCVFFTAWFSASVSSFNPRGEWLSGLSGKTGEQVEVTGIVCGDPDVLPTSNPGKVAVRFPLYVEKMKCKETILSMGQGNIQVSCYGSGKYDLPLYGERWRIFGKISAQKFVSKTGHLNIGPPCLKANSYNTHFVSGGQGWWFADRCYAARRAAASYLSAGITEHPETVDVLHSLLLGYRRLSREMRQVFVFTGTLHIFAISGSHVVVMAGIIICLLGMLRISSIYWGLFLGPLLCGYTFATGLQSSAVRACIMAVIFWSASILGRKPDGLAALAVSALVILAVVPTQLFDTGFVLSFVCVLGLIVLYPSINASVQTKLEPDPLRLQPETKTVVAMRSIGKYIWSMIAMSFAAWLASAPLIAWYFGNFTPIGLVSNLIVIPLSFFVILTGCLSLVLGACVQWFAVIFNHANLVLIQVLVGSMELMAKIPYANIKIENLPLWIVFLWYGLLAGWVFWHKCRLMDVEKEGGA